ncbi:MAG TPA: UDP-N-acetylglucosamine 1-carboxyvinyltransferase [Patescibacteria group bacterium]|nr:UDP-N-acetylglucosamine 1-carboxyvinyltransferase [Patescibacteria group bacterium]
MDNFRITGGKKLNGEVAVSGSKNAALPLMGASLLTDENVVLHGIPDLMDVRVLMEILEYIGKNITFKNGTMMISRGKKIKTEAPYELVKKMRASIIVLGPLLAKYKKCRVSLPGGCAFGPRPVDLHIKGMEKLGARVELEHGYITAEAEKLIGASMILASEFGSSVLGTDNVLMAATLAEGQTVIESAAKEPECTDLANMLVKMGADISGIGTSVLKIQGVEKLHGVEYTVIPDRIECGTFVVAAILTNSNVVIKNCIPDHLKYPLEILKDSGAKIEIGKDFIKVKSGGQLKPFSFDTNPYPLFPTDLQAVFMVLACRIIGVSDISEKIYPDRFMHVPELVRLGAKIEIKGQTAIIHGEEKLIGADVQASDLRCGAALVLAGLIAEGESVVHRIYHIDRGYEKLEEKLIALGAEIERF